jgi:hypothetical protein
MTVVRLPQPGSNNRASMQNMEALQTLGEEIIYLSMYHFSVDMNNFPRCQNFDADYDQDDHFKCQFCYGTTYQGGVKLACRAWAIIGDTVKMEDLSRQGVYNKERVHAQLEVTPVAITNDYIIRVAKWSDNHTPLVLGQRYIVEDVTVRSLRTGSRMGQQFAVDYMGQKAQINKLDPNHPIQLYPVDLTTPVPRSPQPLSYGIQMDGRQL